MVTQDGPDSNPRWSPDGTRIAFESAMAQAVLFLPEPRDRPRPAGRPAVQSLTAAFDENPDLSRGRRPASSSRRRSGPGRTCSRSIRRREKFDRRAARDEWIGGAFSLTRRRQHGRVPRIRRPRRFPRSTSRRCHDGGDRSSPTAARRSPAGRSTRAKSCVEEPGRRRDRRRAAQAGRLRGRTPLSRCSS